MWSWLLGIHINTYFFSDVMRTSHYAETYLCSENGECVYSSFAKLETLCVGVCVRVCVCSCVCLFVPSSACVYCEMTNVLVESERCMTIKSYFDSRQWKTPSLLATTIDIASFIHSFLCHAAQSSYRIQSPGVKVRCTMDNYFASSYRALFVTVGRLYIKSQYKSQKWLASKRHKTDLLS